MSSQIAHVNSHDIHPLVQLTVCANNVMKWYVSHDHQKQHYISQVGEEG